MTRHSSKTMASVTESITGAKRYRPYPAYRDSGIEWLGEIPAHWKTAPIYARYQVALGKMLDAKKNFGDSPGEYIRNSDVQWDSVNSTNLPTMDFSPQERDRYRIQFGDLLVCEGGEVGRTATWKGTTGEYFYQKAIHRVRPLSDQEVPRFLYYTMRMLSAKGVFVAGSNPNTINHLTAVQLRHYRVLFPPCADQIAIAAFLDDETEKIDELVAKKERLIELLHEKRAALITRTVTKGIDPDVPMKDSGVEWLADIPERWNTARMWQLSEAISGGTPSRDEPRYWGGLVPWVSPKDMKRRLLDDTEEKITERGRTEGGLRLVRPPAVLIVVRGMILAHSFPVALASVPLTINQDMKALKLGEGVDARYFGWLLDGIAHQILATAIEKSGHGTRAVRMDEWRSVELPLPPILEQRSIADFLDSETAEIDTLVTKVHEAIDRLKELRTALIAAAVTGKIDVREIPE